MLNIRKYSLGPIQTNCYIVSNKKKDCLIFDPGEEGLRIVSELRKNGLNPLAILLTHTHFDHIGGIDAVREVYNIPLYVHEKEVEWLTDPMKNGSGKYAELPNYIVKKHEEDHVIRKEGEMTIGEFTFTVAHTPGHSPGSVSFIFKEDAFAIVGDTLFEQSIGRTDLIGGSMNVLLKSIHDKLLSLPEDTIIYPGHGEYTTPAAEMDSNPFLNGF